MTTVLAETPAHQGKSLFDGSAPLKGTLRGHQNALPPDVIKCINCHGATGVSITRTYLLEMRQRRGGPPSAYTQPAFCKLLRTGIDPVYILIAHQMPIYQVTDLECRALWQFLLEGVASNAKH